MRIYIDCTDTYLGGSNTGIQRVVRNYASHSRRLVDRMNAECVLVIQRNGRYVQIHGLDNLSFKNLANAVRHGLHRHYLRFVHWVARTSPSAGVRRFFLAQRHEFGFAKILYFPIELLSRLGQGFTSASKIGAPDPGLSASVGDVLLLADLSWSRNVWDAALPIKAHGAHLVVVIHDVIPLSHPHFVRPHVTQRFGEWIQQVWGEADLVLCFSEFTRQSLLRYGAGHSVADRPRIEVVCLGHDFATPAHSEIQHSRLARVLRDPRPVFLCVGTLEPRKNHAILLEAFERRWLDGGRTRLILIGRYGWLCEALVQRISEHSRLGRELHWFDDVRDEDLARTYSRVTGLVYPSFTEGFGLPLVEALAQGAAVLASDIPVFRELASGHAQFFDPHDALQLAGLIEQLESPRSRPAPAGSRPFRWPSWEDCTWQMLQKLRTVEAAGRTAG